MPGLPDQVLARAEANFEPDFFDWVSEKPSQSAFSWRLA
jgi:hypothetical protein